MANGNSVGIGEQGNVARQGNTFLDWLVPSEVRRDIASLMRKPFSQKKMMSKDKFVDEYWTQGYNPAFGGESRHYSTYPYDPDYVTLPTKTTAGGSEWTADREKTGFKFHGSESATKQAAYDLYVEEWNAKQAEGESFDIDPSKVDYFDPESIMGGLDVVGKKHLQDDWGDTSYGKLGTEAIRGFKPGQFRGLHASAYSPYVEQQRNPLERSLVGKRELARSAGGGFSGYGRRGLLEEASEGSFLEGMENVYGNVDIARSGALEDIYSQLGGWEDLMGKYGGDE